MVPLLVVKLEEIVRFYCSRFVLPVTMEKANSTLKLIKFDFFYENIYWPDVEVRYGIAEELRKLEDKGKIKDDPIHKFKRECRSFLATLFKHMVEKSPVQSSFVHFSRALSPVYMAEKSKSCKALLIRRCRSWLNTSRYCQILLILQNRNLIVFLHLLSRKKAEIS